MIDAARAAAMADPELNRWFRRRWAEPAGLPAVVVSNPQSHDEIDVTAQELLAAWRSERIARETRREDDYDEHGYLGQSATDRA